MRKDQNAVALPKESQGGDVAICRLREPGSLFEPVRNPALVRSYGDISAHAIADQDANSMLAHLARDRSECRVIAVIKSHFENALGCLS